MMKKRLRLLMNLVLLVGSALVSAPAVWAHNCDSAPVMLNPGGSVRRTIDGETCTTTYSNPTIAASLQGIVTVSLAPVEHDDVVVTFEASRTFSGPPVTGMVTVPWTTTCPEARGTCTYTVTVSRSPSAFSFVESVCSSDGSPRTIYINRSDVNFGVTIDASTTCQQEFEVLDLTTGDPFGNQILNNEGRTFELLVLSNTRIVMTCTGSGDCSYRIRGFATTGEISENCRFGPEPIYENMTGKAVAVTVGGTSSCQSQSFTVLDSDGDELPGGSGSGSVSGGMTGLFSFNVPPGGSIMMQCNSVEGTGDCRYILAVKTGTPQSGQVSCNRRQQIYRNSSGRDLDVTVQATAACNEATLTVDGSPGGDPIPPGETRTRTFTVPNRGTINLQCSGRGGGNCSYTVVEGA